jgi:hypothetical protein
MVRYVHVGRHAGRAAGMGRAAGARPGFARWFGRWPFRRAVRVSAAPRLRRESPVEPGALAVAELRRPVWPGWEYGEAYVPSWAAVTWAQLPVPLPSTELRERMDAALLELVFRSGGELVCPDSEAEVS